MTGNELLARRRSLGLSQSELGEKLGVPANTIARWERGELTIASPNMLRWALKAIEEDMANLSNEEQYARNIKHQEETERRIAEEEAAGPSPERDAAERWFGRH